MIKEKTITKTRVVKLYPSATMKKVLDDWCDYRRYCWNTGLDLWNELYFARKLALPNEFKKRLREEMEKKERDFSWVTKLEKSLSDMNPSPNERNVRDILVENKQDWQYQYSARTLQLAVKDLSQAWKHFFDKSQPNWGMPKFKSKKDKKQGFKMDQARIKNGRLILEHPRENKAKFSPIRMSEKPLSDKFGVISITRINDEYFASIPYKVTKPKTKAKTGRNTGVDVNVGHYNYLDGVFKVLPKQLDREYKRIKHYQRSLALKRNTNGKQASSSNNYAETRTKLQRSYQRVKNLQTDILQKLTTKLVTDYDKIVIEDLSVKGMLMSHVASKGVHKSMFGMFKQVLAYKCEWYGKKLIMANRLYPSTQRCANCGFVKKGDEKITLYGNQKHHTKHNEYICYECGYKNDRDDNAMLNLLYLVDHPELNKAL